MSQITYGSVCSGIEAASVAWEPLGWKPLWFSEIEPFPSAVLAHHWPQVPNLGDFTGIRHKLADGSVEAPDVLVGGTPCQAYSVAGLRKSLDDARGQLTLQFVGLANAIDDARSLRGRNPCTVVWENVPGVLSTKDNAFGCFLADLVGAEEALVPGTCPDPGKSSAVWRWDGKSGKHIPSWPVRGVVSGPRRSLAWRTLDAQWFGVAQRRRRVFVVASAGAVCPEKVLFEFDGVRRDSPPSREAGKGIAHDAVRRAGERSHWDGRPQPSLTQSNNIGGVGMSNQEIFSQRGAYLAPHPAAPCLQAGGKSAGSATQQDAESGALVVQSFDGYNQNVGDVAQAIRANKSDGDHVGMVFYAATQHHGKVEACVAGPITRQQHQGITGDMPIVGYIQAVAATGDVFHTLRAEGLAPTMRSMGHNESHANGGGQLAVAFGVSESPDLGHCLRSGASKADKHESTTCVQTGMQVRRLTPTECARLQGFPDHHARIPWRKHPAEECPDGPQYKAYGNSMAVPVMHWIGRRLDQHLKAAT